MPPKKKSYTRPELRLVDPTCPSDQGWTDEQIVQVQSLITRAIALVGTDDRLREVSEKLRLTLDQLDSELSRNREPLD